MFPVARGSRISVFVELGMIDRRYLIRDDSWSLDYILRRRGLGDVIVGFANAVCQDTTLEDGCEFGSFRLEIT